MKTAAVQSALRDVILDAMERLLARYGYKKTTMDDLAGEAGIGKGTIYLYFPSKEEVALQSIDRVVERVQDRLRAIAGSKAGVAEKLRQMMLERVLQRFDSVHAYSQSLDDLFESLRPAYMERRQKYFQAEADLFAKVLAEGRRQGVLALDDLRATAYTLLLATNSLLPYSLSTRELGERAEIEAQARRIADLLLYGLLQSKSKKPLSRSEREMVR
jgi:AcrR family transcriptional regulator